MSTFEDFWTVWMVGTWSLDTAVARVTQLQL